MFLSMLREEVYRLHLELPRSNLVVWTMGNVSARDPDSGLVVIKPSGVRFENLSAESMVVVDIDSGKVLPDEVRWSKLLQGFRGTPPCDVEALKDVILRLSELLRL